VLNYGLVTPLTCPSTGKGGGQLGVVHHLAEVAISAMLGPTPATAPLIAAMIGVGTRNMIKRMLS
jgi:flagellar motor component MotA